MSEARPKPTLMDYMAIAISPSMIILLVGSLAFFLLMVFYAGDFVARLYWTTGCFVFAAVLISRVSIEEGAERASLFGIALGGVAALAMSSFTNHPWWAWLVLGVIWWCASHLVWNCTVVDDDDDASGAGLLEAAGFDAALSTTAVEPKEAPPLTAAVRRKRRKVAAAKAAETPKQDSTEQPWIKRAFAWWQRSRSQKAPPGLTVVYFSLAALPIFGLGQRFIASDERLYAFQCLFVYVASALGLLVTTSFLGLRRYLRQRRLEMPVEMAGTWLAVGAAMVGIVLILAVLIPRPQPEYAISSVTGMLSSPEREASPYSPMHDSPAQGESSSGAEKPEGSEQQAEGSQKDGSRQSAAASSAEKPGEKGEGSTAQGGSTSASSSGQQQSGNSSPPQGQQSQGQQTQPSQQSQQAQQNQSARSSGEQQQQQQQRDQANKNAAQQPAGQQQSQQQSPQQQANTAADSKSGQQRGEQRQQSQQPQQAQQSQQQQSANSEKSGNEGSQQQQQQQQQQREQQQQAAKQDGSAESGDQRQSDQQASSETNKGSQDSMSSKMAQNLGQRWQQRPRLRPPPLASAGGFLWLLKMLVYAVVVIAVIYVLIRYGAQVRAFLHAMWRRTRGIVAKYLRRAIADG